jgi:2',3'-cyclic-nucleotide 2'-phosphodiesterase (5'-nucleotidase family)
MTAGEFSRILLISFLAAACSPPGKITKVETRQYAFRDTVNASVDSVMEKEIQPYRNGMSGKMNEVIANSDIALTKGQPESLLGNLFSDVCFEMANQLYYTSTYTKADFAFFNNGGLRAELPKGKITRGNVYELMPFENELVVVSLTGSQVKKIVDYMASKDGVPVSHIHFRIKEKQPLDIKVNGEPFDSTKSYKAVTSDYLANGGDQYFFLTDAKKEYVNLKIRDAMISYLQGENKKGNVITASLDKRISYAE